MFIALFIAGTDARRHRHRHHASETMPAPVATAMEGIVGDVKQSIADGTSDVKSVWHQTKGIMGNLKGLFAQPEMRAKMKENFDKMQAMMTDGKFASFVQGKIKENGMKFSDGFKAYAANCASKNTSRRREGMMKMTRGAIGSMVAPVVGKLMMSTMKGMEGEPGKVGEMLSMLFSTKREGFSKMWTKMGLPAKCGEELNALMDEANCIVATAAVRLAGNNNRVATTHIVNAVKALFDNQEFLKKATAWGKSFIETKDVSNTSGAKFVWGAMMPVMMPGMGKGMDMKKMMGDMFTNKEGDLGTVVKATIDNTGRKFSTNFKAYAAKCPQHRRRYYGSYMGMGGVDKLMEMGKDAMYKGKEALTDAVAKGKDAMTKTKEDFDFLKEKAKGMAGFGSFNPFGMKMDGMGSMVSGMVGKMMKKMMADMPGTAGGRIGDIISSFYTNSPDGFKRMWKIMGTNAQDGETLKALMKEANCIVATGAVALAGDKDVTTEHVVAAVGKLFEHADFLAKTQAWGRQFIQNQGHQQGAKKSHKKRHHHN